MSFELHVIMDSNLLGRVPEVIFQIFSLLQDWKDRYSFAACSETTWNLCVQETRDPPPYIIDISTIDTTGLNILAARTADIIIVENTRAEELQKDNYWNKPS